MTVTYNVAQTGNSRLFLIEGRARADRSLAYQNCMRMGSISKDFGEAEPIYCPSDDRYDQFDEVGSIKGDESRPTTSLEGKMGRDVASSLMRLARQQCAIDAQLHFGLCEDPRQANVFEMAIIFENAGFSNYSTDDLGALSPDARAEILETADLTGKAFYQVLPLDFAEVAASIVTNEVLDVALCDTLSCGDECEDVSDGCQKFFAITKAAGGSPSTPADVVFSLDGGGTWYAHDIDALGIAEDPDEVDCVGDYLVVVSNAAGGIAYALLSEFTATDDPDFTLVTTGVVAGGEPNAIFSNGQHAFVVGDNGYIYETEDPTSGLTLLDAGTWTGADDLNAVHAIGETEAVAVGDNSAIVHTSDGDVWEGITPPTGVGINYLTVAMKNSDEWFIGTDDGRLFYTLDGGDTWTSKGFSGSGTGAVRHIEIATDSVMYLAHSTTTPAGRIFRSIDGGNSWSITPRSTIGTMPANDQINAIAACDWDPNLVIGVGLGDDASDGIIVVGQD